MSKERPENMTLSNFCQLQREVIRGRAGRTTEVGGEKEDNPGDSIGDGE